MIKEKNKGLAAIIIANTIFGLNIPVTKYLITQWMTPTGYTMVRMFFGTFIFWLIGAFSKKERVKDRDMIVIAVGGLLGYVGTQFLFSLSLKFTTPVIYSLLMALTPMVVLILSASFLKESLSRRKVLGIMISIVGTLLIILLSNKNENAASNNFMGIVFAVLCVLSYAGYLTLTRKISVKYQPVTIAKWMFLFSALVLMPFSFSGLQNQKFFSPEGTAQAFSLLAFALIFSTTLAFFLMPYALKKLEAGTVSIFMNLQPVVATFIAIAAGQDIFSWDKPLAVVLVLTGVYLVTTRKR
jgi:drug/metabolite transporter (DMT)-like permease